MSDFLTMLAGMLGAGLLAWSLTEARAEKRIKQAKESAYARGEKAGRLHARTFYRYEPVVHRSLDALLGPTVEEPAS
jgi:phage-related minor tail protein